MFQAESAGELPFGQVFGFEFSYTGACLGGAHEQTEGEPPSPSIRAAIGFGLGIGGATGATATTASIPGARPM